MPKHSFWSISIAMLLISSIVASAYSETIPVRFRQGSSHGFVALKTLEGVSIATGEVTQTVQGELVTSRFILHFLDGSVDDDRTVFTQRGTFRLVSDHHVQQGPFFPKPMDMLIEAETGQITSRTLDGKVVQEHLDLPSDVSNGLPPNLIMNIQPSVAETKISYVAPGSKPRLVHLSIKPTETVSFKVGGIRRKATDFTIHVELGGVVGVVAPMIGKEPKDTHLWLQPGNPPAFIREEGQIYEGGPVLRMEQVSPRLTR
jgi:hypothetical protein